MISSDYDEGWFRAFRKSLLKWYNVNHRELPWRDTHDPYAIWISETMLQQTQVATVIDYYHRFLIRFPDVSALARAEEQEVLQLWAGLGYYRRAKQLHAAAKMVVERFDGVFPKRFDDVLELPGIGRYTAGAITSFAYDQRSPIVEANTVRLFSRLLGLRDDPTARESQKRLWGFAESILPAKRGSGLVNQAAMELGSLVCVPQNPNCAECPLHPLCPTFRNGLHASIPKPKPKKIFEEQTHVLAVIRRKGKLLVRQNEAGEWWHGLWDFPRTQIHTLHGLSWRPREGEELEGKVRSLVESAFLESLGLDCAPKVCFHTLRHGVTRYKIEVFCFEADLPTKFRVSKLPGNWGWLSALGDASFPLTATAQRLRMRLAAAE